MYNRKNKEFYHYLLDTSGLNCPLPILKLKQQIQKSKNQEIILLISTDPKALEDISLYCQTYRHLLVHHFEEKNTYYLYVQKNS